LIYNRLQLKKTLTLQKELAEYEQKALHLQMNPHFVFNSLNTLQSFILKQDYKDANSYLVKFSKLIRLILENNVSGEIPLDHEIDMLQRYLELENLRFRGNISYRISIDDDISPATIKIPVMMIQPFVENAIWHGLLNKEGVKLLIISFSLQQGQYLLCIIDDNGVGRNKEKTEDSKKSLATVFIEQRLMLLNKMYKQEGYLRITDKEEGGTRIELRLPIIKNTYA